MSTESTTPDPTPPSAPAGENALLARIKSAYLDGDGSLHLFDAAGADIEEWPTSWPDQIRHVGAFLKARGIYLANGYRDAAPTPASAGTAETPITDYEEKRLDHWLGARRMVYADTARKLETDLAAQRAECDGLMGDHDRMAEVLEEYGFPAAQYNTGEKAIKDFAAKFATQLANAERERDEARISDSHGADV